MLMKNVNGIDMPLDAADLAQREIDAAQAPMQTAPPSTTISKIRLVEALAGMGKLRQAYALLKLDAPLDGLTDAELALRERWNAAHTIDLALPEVMTVLTALDVSAEALLR